MPPGKQQNIVPPIRIDLDTKGASYGLKSLAAESEKTAQSMYSLEGGTIGVTEAMVEEFEAAEQANKANREFAAALEAEAIAAKKAEKALEEAAKKQEKANKATKDGVKGTQLFNNELKYLIPGMGALGEEAAKMVPGFAKWAPAIAKFVAMKSPVIATVVSIDSVVRTLSASLQETSKSTDWIGPWVFKPFTDFAANAEKFWTKGKDQAEGYFATIARGTDDWINGMKRQEAMWQKQEQMKVEGIAKNKEVDDLLESQMHADGYLKAAQASRFDQQQKAYALYFRDIEEVQNALKGEEERIKKLSTSEELGGQLLDRKAIVEAEKKREALLERLATLQGERSQFDQREVQAGYAKLKTIKEIQEEYDELLAQADHDRATAGWTNKAAMEFEAKRLAILKRVGEIQEQQTANVKAYNDLQKGEIERIANDQKQTDSQSLSSLGAIQAKRKEILAEARRLNDANDYGEEAQRRISGQLSAINEQEKKIKQAVEETARAEHEHAQEILAEMIKAKTFDKDRIEEQRQKVRDLAGVRKDAVKSEADMENERHRKKMENLQKEIEKQSAFMDALKEAGGEMAGQQQSLSQMANQGPQGGGNGFGGGSGGLFAGGGPGGGYGGSGGSEPYGVDANGRPIRGKKVSTQYGGVLGMGFGGAGPGGFGQFGGFVDNNSGMAGGFGDNGLGPDGRPKRRGTSAERRDQAMRDRNKRLEDAERRFRTPVGGMDDAAEKQRYAQMYGGKTKFGQTVASQVDPALARERMFKNREERIQMEGMFAGDSDTDINQRIKSSRRELTRDIRRGNVDPAEEAKAVNDEMKRVVEGLENFQGITGDNVASMKKMLDEINNVAAGANVAARALQALEGLGIGKSGGRNAVSVPRYPGNVNGQAASGRLGN